MMIVSEKITSKFIELYSVFIKKKRFEVNKKWIFFSEKMRKTGNYIYDYAHWIFEEDL